jgi:hypothetical protein
MEKLKTRVCKRGHTITPKNSTSRGYCKICRHEREGYAGGISNADKTHCPQGHPLVGANLYTYTDADGHSRRLCRRCHAERGRKYYWTKVKPIMHPNIKPGRPRKY